MPFGLFRGSFDTVYPPVAPQSWNGASLVSCKFVVLYLGVKLWIGLCSGDCQFLSACTLINSELHILEINVPQADDVTHIGCVRVSFYKLPGSLASSGHFQHRLTIRILDETSS